MATVTHNPPAGPGTVELRLKVLGRTIEHFGVQMYKQRPAAIAELVANCWDAGAKSARVTIPDQQSWGASNAQIVIQDSGCGMSITAIQEEYLVLGRNRRDGPSVAGASNTGRRIMGRKGIGKLAGFGIADEMEVQTWRDGKGTKFLLRVAELRVGDAEVKDVPIRGETFHPPAADGEAGTKVILRKLRNKTPLAADALLKSLARRFSRAVQGEMTITVNGAGLPDPLADYDVIKSVPDDFPGKLDDHTLPDGRQVRFGYVYTQKTIKESEMAGFTVLVHGKTAQAPPFFFRVENTASGQHATKYLSGVIEADFLDDAADSNSDVISTDRQEIDWGHPSAECLLAWGSDLARKCLKECTEFRGERKAKDLSLDPDFKTRLARLDKASQKQVHRLIGAITYTDADDERVAELADSLLKVFEFRHFHDMVEEIEEVAEHPALLAERLALVNDWKILESRAIYEVIQGRIAVIDMFDKALAVDIPETASKVGGSNLHDAIGQFPWLLNPDYHIFTEEKTITTLLYELAGKAGVEVSKERVDFCAIGDDKRLVLVEIKRSSHAVEFDEIQRLDGYAEQIARSRPQEITRILVFGGNLNIAKTSLKPLKRRTDFELRPWNRLFQVTRRRYERYRAILHGQIDHRDFKAAEGEAAKVRAMVQTGSFYRTPSDRKKGLGSQAK